MFVSRARGLGAAKRYPFLDAAANGYWTSDGKFFVGAGGDVDSYSEALRWEQGIAARLAEQEAAARQAAQASIDAAAAQAAAAQQAAIDAAARAAQRAEADMQAALVAAQNARTEAERQAALRAAEEAAARAAASGSQVLQQMPGSTVEIDAGYGPVQMFPTGSGEIAPPPAKSGNGALWLALAAAAATMLG